MTLNCDNDHIKYDTIDCMNSNDQIRSSNLVKKFTQLVGSKPEYLLVCPGRVNIIGDHVDYHGFDVLPMAIEKTILFACRIVDDHKNQLRLFNADTERHPSWSGNHSLRYGANLHKSHEWQNYILCGYHGVLAEQVCRIEASKVYEHSQKLHDNQDELQSIEQRLKNLKSIDIVVDSDLPEASGLSSSSALVCASAMATLLLLHHSSINGFLNDDLLMIARRKLAISCAKYEHLIGTQGGGMDQAVIMTAQKGYAKHIQFTPDFKCTDVCLPDNIVWLVAHSGVRCPKAASSGFNSRVLETKLGAAIIAKTLSSTSGDIMDSSVMTLNQVKNRFFANKSIDEIIEILRKVFDGKDFFTIDEVCSKLDMSRDELIRKFKTSEDFITRCLNNTVRLLSRCEHVFEEADRVDRFRLGCINKTGTTTLGQIMSESHRSLQQKYECSDSSLNKIVDIAIAAGAAGARLTGAGWGGCVIVLTTTDNFTVVADKLKENCEFLFRSEPQAGCKIIQYDHRGSNEQ